jgi:hypothetical protein
MFFKPKHSHREDGMSAKEEKKDKKNKESNLHSASSHT